MASLPSTQLYDLSYPGRAGALAAIARAREEVYETEALACADRCSTDLHAFVDLLRAAPAAGLDRATPRYGAGWSARATAGPLTLVLHCGAHLVCTLDVLRGRRIARYTSSRTIALGVSDMRNEVGFVGSFGPGGYVYASGRALAVH